jgi:apolipoprotein D and lipocalin family protein
MARPGAIRLTVACLAALAVHAGAEEPVPVARVELPRYIGQWREISRIPNRFQRQCLGEVTASYALLPDGRLEVVNRCATVDGADEARGIARVVDPSTNARLKVSFVRLLGISLFWGDYWILGLAPDYSWAVVGTPDRRYGWVLSRRPELGDEAAAAIREILVRQGYEPAAFVPTAVGRP